METDFFYADIQVGITLKVIESGALSELTDNEVSSLRQILYLALNSFVYVRALYAADVAAIERAKRAFSQKKDNEPDGG